MRKNFYSCLVLTLVTLLLFSCSEKDEDLEASPDMLFFVRANDPPIVEVKDVPNKKEIVEAINKKLQEKAQFVRGNVYEMKQGSGKTIDFYESLDAFYDQKIKSAGKYSFETDAMYVTFDFDGISNTYFIDGYFGNSFYNHFVRKEGIDSHHIVEERQVFCLHIDYTEELQKDYPDLVLARIKTDMITIRRLETFK